MVGVLSSLRGGSVVDGIFGDVGTRVGTGFVAVVVFGPGTTMVEAMPDSAMVKPALGEWANVTRPYDEGDEPTVGCFSSSRAVAVVAGTGNMDIERMLSGFASMLGPACFRTDFFGWVAAVPW